MNIHTRALTHIRSYQLYSIHVWGQIKANSPGFRFFVAGLKVVGWSDKNKEIKDVSTKSDIKKRYNKVRLRLLIPHRQALKKRRPLYRYENSRLFGVSFYKSPEIPKYLTQFACFHWCRDTKEKTRLHIFRGLITVEVNQMETSSLVTNSFKSDSRRGHTSRVQSQRESCY